MMPKRIQRRRVKGWRMPEGAIAVTRPSEWGNPFKIGHHYRRGVGGFIYMEAYAPEDGYTTIQTAEEAVAWYRWYVEQIPKKLQKIIDSLSGKDLACFCALDQPCHADVLLEIANAQEVMTEQEGEQ